MLFERYLAAAEKVMSTAILNDHKPRPITTKAELLKITGGPDRGNTEFSRRVDERESSLTQELTMAGKYTLLLEVSAPKLGNEPTKIEAKWLGDCKPNQKPGDIVMPGGFKLNVKDAEKLKGLLQKSN